MKITDAVSFPLIMNMNDYMKGYEGIENKLYEKEVERMQHYKAKEIEKNQQVEEKRRIKLQG